MATITPFAQAPTQFSYSTGMLAFPPEIGTNAQYKNYVVFFVNQQNPAQSSGSQVTIQPPASTHTPMAIVLPIMEAPVARYGADWDVTTLGPILGWALQTPGNTNFEAGVLDTITNLGSQGGAGKMYDQAKGAFPHLVDVAKVVSLSVLNQVGGIVGVGGSAGNTDIYQILTKTAINEHRTQIFKTMRFRNFQFEYHLTPRNAQEAATIQSIILHFKLAMHSGSPDSNNGLVIDLPNTFNIGFYFQGQENGALFNISECALTDFEADYGGENFYTFKDGQPTQIIMKLAFTELEILSKQRIQDGGF